MQPFKTNNYAGKPHKIQLTLTEAILFAALFGLCTLTAFGALFVRLHKNGTQGGIDWVAALLLVSALSVTERTVGMVRFAVRARRLVSQKRQMQERQKRAGWE